jgi:hypothetical protein
MGNQWLVVAFAFHLCSISFALSENVLSRYGMPSFTSSAASAAQVIPRREHAEVPKDRVVADCHCGRVRVSVAHADVEAAQKHPRRTRSDKTVIDCHCPACRKYHVADRATYLLVDADKVEFSHHPGTSAEFSHHPGTSAEFSHHPGTSAIHVHPDTCEQLGSVLRYQCSHCRTKLATRQQDEGDEHGGEHTHQYLLNLAAVRDETLKKSWTKEWRAFRFPWQYNKQVVWTRARAAADYPDYSAADDGDRSPLAMKGSCSCGTYRYEVNYPSANAAATELQHCYCQLCRRLSGGPFQTWLPVPRPLFSWLPPRDGSSESPHEPPLHRYTDHGRRHVCDSCGGVLTIVYDEDGEDVVWPAAGGLDDDSLPTTKEAMSEHVYGICHICCRYRQAWYALPNDGNERIADAS